MIKKVFWRNVLAMISINIALVMVIIAVKYLPLPYSVISCIYACAIFLLSCLEIAINLDEG
jgi:hypothetical protein